MGDHSNDKMRIENGNGKDNAKATNIAMRTLKDRCFLLERRLRAVEEENVKLSKQCTGNNDNCQDDMNVLNAKIAELTQKNSQLIERNVMIANENKTLWTRLASIISSHSSNVNVKSNKLSQICDIKCDDNKTAMPQLIRSQTFTQNSPNPKLIAKWEEKDEECENSLEEISLKILNSFVAEKSELVLQCEEMVELQKVSDYDVNLVGFTYLGPGTNYDSLADIKRYTEKLIELKNTATQQQNNLKNYIKQIEIKNQEEKSVQASNMKNSPEYIKEEMVDSPETEVMDSSTRWVTPANSTSYHDNIDDSSCSQNTSRLTNHLQSNSKTSSKKDLEENFYNSRKINNVYICPMCGEQFKISNFEKFHNHVESHFKDKDYDSLEEDLALPVQ